MGSDDLKYGRISSGDPEQADRISISGVRVKRGYIGVEVITSEESDGWYDKTRLAFVFGASQFGAVSHMVVFAVPYENFHLDHARLRVEVVGDVVRAEVQWPSQHDEEHFLDFLDHFEGATESVVVRVPLEELTDTIEVVE
jgi:hypothetical protein